MIIFLCAAMMLEEMTTTITPDNFVTKVQDLKSIRITHENQDQYLALAQELFVEFTSCRQRVYEINQILDKE